MNIILLHGLGQSPAAWEEVIKGSPLLQDSLCPDLFTLPRRKSDSYQSLFDAFSQYCQQQPKPLHLCGLSLGGLLALDYAGKYPRQVASLVLIGIPHRIPPVLMGLQDLVFRFAPDSVVGGTGLSREGLRSLCRSMARLEPSSWLPAVQCPTLVLCGQRDRANKRSACMVGKGLARSQVELISGAGHEVNRDAPEILRTRLEAFYDSLEK